MASKHEVELRVRVGQARSGSGMKMTLTGIIEEEVEVVDQADYVEPEIAEHVREKYGVEVEN